MAHRSPLSREDLILLVQQIHSGELPPGQSDDIVALLEQSVPHPDVMDLVADPELSAEEVVDLAMGYNPLDG